MSFELFCELIFLLQKIIMVVIQYPYHYEPAFCNALITVFSQSSQAAPKS